MTKTTDLAGEKRQLTEEQKTVVLELHDRALRMTALAANALRADTTNDYANAMAVVMPLLGYAFETVAKMALALDHFQLTGSMPSPADLIELATYPKHARPFLSQDLPSDFRVRPGFRGHAVGVIIDNVTGRLQVPGAAALRERADMPLYRNCLDAVTASHGFTRYALLDELLSPDDERLQLGGEEGPNELLAGENERRFRGIVSKIDRVVAADYGATFRQGHTAIAERHSREFLPTVAAAYWALFVSVSQFLAEELSNFDGSHRSADRLRDGIAAQVQDWVTQGWPRVGIAGDTRPVGAVARR